MDILTHALSGTVIAACAASFSNKKTLGKAKIILAGTVGGILPDLDAISMWSKFDATIGSFFNLPYTGKKIYGMKLWYSHHAFFHSMLASILFGIMLLGIAYFFYKVVKQKNETIRKVSFLKTNLIYSIAFTLGYWAHLAGDLPTPSSVWNGIAFFWPSQEYIGGYGKIWWWNNYDIFLLILISIFIIILTPICFTFIKKRAKIFSVSIFTVMLILITIQINTRQYDYSYERNTKHYAEMEQNSKKEQERILGKRIYSYMAWFDSKLKFYF